MGDRGAKPPGEPLRRPPTAADGPPGLPRNFLRQCLLLLVAEEPSHGYDLLLRLAAFGFQRSDPGGLYRTLRAMEQEGLITSTWSPSELGPPRRTYGLTEEGVDWLHAYAASLRDTRRLVDGFLARYTAVPAGLAER